MDGVLDAPVLITWTGSVNWTVGFLTTVGIFAIVALALNLQWGYTGVFNFGVVAFFMVGAYTSSLLTLEPASEFEDYALGLEWPIPIGWIAGALAAGVLALLVGLPTLRLRRSSHPILKRSRRTRALRRVRLLLWRTESVECPSARGRSCSRSRSDRCCR